MQKSFRLPESVSKELMYRIRRQTTLIHKVSINASHFRDSIKHNKMPFRQPETK